MMKRLFYIFLSCWMLSGIDAQVVHSDRMKELLRVGQLVGGKVALPSMMVNANQVSGEVLDSLLENTKPLRWTTKGLQLGLVPLQFTQQYHEKQPYEWNGGALLPSRGYQVLGSVGVHAKVGKNLYLQLAPEFTTSQNLDYEGFNQQMGDRAWADRYRFWNTADIPQQYGNGRQTSLLPGQSFIEYRTQHFAFGISSQNLWWGPGFRNALVMSSNAPGFVHWSVKTHQPIKTRIGNFEGQMVGGRLEASGILPPRINSLYNGAFVYQPKPDEDRYMTGMVISWNPKWTPGLYVGLAKASYLYQRDLSNPLDVLPLQGFFGNKLTGTEKSGKKASLGSLFVRYVMPKEKAELYVEYGRKDRAMLPWNLLQAEPYRRAYVAGINKLFRVGPDAHLQFQAEFTQLQAPTADLIRSPDSWYTDANVRHGYTHQGRVLGAGIGPGSNSQTFGLSWVKGLKRIGFQFERVRYNSDFYYFAFEYIGDFRRHWVDLAGMIKFDFPIGPVFVSGQTGLVRSYNYQWWIVQYNPNDFFIPGNEVLNFTGRLGVGWRF
jgi:hypothetical protein